MERNDGHRSPYVLTGDVNELLRLLALTSEAMEGCPAGQVFVCLFLLVLDLLVLMASGWALKQITS